MNSSSYPPFQILLHAPHTSLERVQTAIATGFGIGFLPKIPGTAASAAALCMMFLPNTYINFALSASILTAFSLGLWAVPTVERLIGDDPPCVVIDEFLGMWIALLSPVVPRSLFWICTAFVLFRVFDIAKIYPANILNARRGAFFVMVDDVVAGFYALCTVHLLWLMYQLFEFYGML
jgi:phosphatidylglycerophosphatase A